MEDYTGCSTQVGIISDKDIIEELRQKNQRLEEELQKYKNQERRYFLLAEQEGEGCDYTIACGKYYEELSSNLDDAKEETKEYIEDRCSTDFKEVLILEVTKVIKKVFPKKEWDDE